MDDLRIRLISRHSDTWPIQIGEHDLINRDGPDAEKRIAELEAALAPFANFDTEDFPDDMRAFKDDSTLTMRHFRAAKAALQKSTQ